MSSGTKAVLWMGIVSLAGMAVFGLALANSGRARAAADELALTTAVERLCADIGSRAWTSSASAREWAADELREEFGPGAYGDALTERCGDALEDAEQEALALRKRLAADSKTTSQMPVTSHRVYRPRDGKAAATFYVYLQQYVPALFGDSTMEEAVALGFAVCDSLEDNSPEQTVDAYVKLLGLDNMTATRIVVAADDLLCPMS